MVYLVGGPETGEEALGAAHLLPVLVDADRHLGVLGRDVSHVVLLEQIARRTH